jgi:hypothetical protein
MWPKYPDWAARKLSKHRCRRCRGSVSFQRRRRGEPPCGGYANLSDHRSPRPLSLDLARGRSIYFLLPASRPGLHSDQTLTVIKGLAASSRSMPSRDRGAADAGGMGLDDLGHAAVGQPRRVQSLALGDRPEHRAGGAGPCTRGREEFRQFAAAKGVVQHAECGRRVAEALYRQWSDSGSVGNCSAAGG